MANENEKQHIILLWFEMRHERQQRIMTALASPSSQVQADAWRESTRLDFLHSLMVPQLDSIQQQG